MSLYENINRRKKAGTSRSKKNSTISDKAYKQMKAGFPKRKKSMGRPKCGLNNYTGEECRRVATKVENIVLLNAGDVLPT